MWYFLLLFPLFFKLLYIIKLINFKFNFIKVCSNLGILFSECNLNYTLIRQDINFNNHLMYCLDSLIGFTELLPLSYKFYFHYRNKRYLELFYIKTFIKYKTKNFFKIINELFINFLKRYKLFSINFNFKKGILVVNVNLKYFLYFNKYISASNDFNTVINLYFKLDSSIVFFQTLALRTFFFKNCLKFINCLKFHV